MVRLLLLERVRILSPLRGIVQEAFHVPGFSSHIITGNLPSDKFEVIKSSSIRFEMGCFVFKKSSLNKQEKVWETACCDGLNKIHMTGGSNNSKALIASKEATSFREWHSKTDHVSSDRYQELSGI